MSPLRNIIGLVLGTIVVSILAGCSSAPTNSIAFAAADMEMSRARANESPPRLLIRTGEITISVEDPVLTQAEVETVIQSVEGYVEHSRSDEKSVWITCRVPAEKLAKTIDEVGQLGQPVSRSTSASDVTNQHADLKARLATSRQLRTRMRDLLERATLIKDLLAIEKALARVQSEIESMETQLEGLDSRIALSSLEIRIQQEQVLGPLGLVGYWTGWAISKLFVIQ
jgi:hypothetical protein